MSTEKNDVIAFLAKLPERHVEQFNKGLELLRGTDGRIPSQMVHLNKVGFTMGTLSTVIYELKKLHRISDTEIKNFGTDEKIVHHLPETIGQKFAAALKNIEGCLRLPILLPYKFLQEFNGMDDGGGAREIFEVVSTAISSKPFLQFLETNPFKIENPAEANNYHLDEVFSELQPEIDAAEYPDDLKEKVEQLRQIKAEKYSLDQGDSGKTDDAAATPISENKQIPDADAIESQIIKVFEGASDQVKNEIKFREEFSFLSDPNLPEELKILATDKITHYHMFADSQRALAAQLVPAEGKTPEEIEQLTNDQIFMLAKKAVENFQADQEIREEFVHYKETGQVLGHHPIFRKRKLQESVDNMTTAELAKRVTLLDNYIRRGRSDIEKATTAEKKAKVQEKVTSWTSELAMVNIKLGASAAK